MNNRSSKITKQAVWWREIVQKIIIQDIFLNQKEYESIFERVNQVTRVMKEYASLQNARDNEKILKASRERKPVNKKE